MVNVPAEDALRQLHAMVVAPMRLAALAFPSMRSRGEGRIVNLSSVAAHATAAMTGWYQASKHALSAVTDALRREVAADGIDVVLIEPGGMQTAIWDKAAGDLVRRRRNSGSPVSYDRSLRVLCAAQPFMGAPSSVAEVIGRVDRRPASDPLPGRCRRDRHPVPRSRRSGATQGPRGSSRAGGIGRWRARP